MNNLVVEMGGEYAATRYADRLTQRDRREHAFLYQRLSSTTRRIIGEMRHVLPSGWVEWAIDQARQEIRVARDARLSPGFRRLP